MAQTNQLTNNQQINQPIKPINNSTLIKNNTTQKSINAKRNMAVVKNALPKYESLIKKSCKTLNLNWLMQSLEQLPCILNDYEKRHVKPYVIKQKRLRPIPELVDALSLIIRNEGFIRTVDLAERLGISIRTARKYLKILCDKRYCIRGKWFGYTDINPFLHYLIFADSTNMIEVIAKFVPEQVDLFDLLSYPLMEAFHQKVENVEFVWAQWEPDFGHRYFPIIPISQPIKMYPFFNGMFQAKIETDSKTYYVTLPYNIHWTGRNCDITLPISFMFYGIQEACYSDKDNELKIHFDNSIKVGIPLGSASYTTRKLLREWKLRHWSEMANDFLHKHWKNEYAECNDFQTHEEVIKNRLYYKAIPIKQVQQGDLILKQFLVGLSKKRLQKHLKQK